MKYSMSRCAIAALLLVPAVQAHEMWVGSNRYVLQYPNPIVGKPLLANLWVGYAHRMPADEPLLGKFFGGIHVVGPDGKSVSTNAPMEDGLHSVSYEFKKPGAYIFSTGTANLFNINVRDAAGKISTIRASKLDPAPAGFTIVPDSCMHNRHIGKTIVFVKGEGATDGYATKPTGLDCEMVPSKNPATVRVGETLTVQLLLNGSPYTEEPIEVAAENMMSVYLGGAGRWTGETDKEGRVTVPITLPGVWKLVATINVPAEGEFAKKVDHTRFRATLSFETPGSIAVWH